MPHGAGDDGARRHQASIPSACASSSNEFSVRMGELEAEAHALAGRPFNLGSAQADRRHPVRRDGPGGAARRPRTGGRSTDAYVLEDLAAQGHELPRVLLDWRQLSKLKGTYTDNLIAAIDPSDQPGAHLLRPGRDHDGPPVLVRPQPAEHPDPHRGRPQDPQGLHRRAGQGADQRRLQPDRAAPAGPHRRHPAAEEGLRRRAWTSTP